MKKIGLIVVGLCLGCGVQRAAAVESLCAEVQISIQQEATLIRQGFDANMIIRNGLPVSLDQVAVSVQITDAREQPVPSSADPGNTNAAFFVRVDYTEGAGTPVTTDGAVSNGTVAASTSADLHWLIIPTLKAGVTNQLGELFYVGATLTYMMDGKVQSVTVAPDSIVVKPLPELELDYFLPGTVYGLDPMTGTGEVVPFSLGVAVRNFGSGTAKNMKISSAQPAIVRNDNGLLAGFAITGTEVNGVAQNNSLLVDFGTIAPGAAALGRWTMESSLFGTFTNFTAEFSHADELGGMLTSLIPADGIRTHMLLRDVRVDLPGRDAIRDFLTTDMKLYESDGTTATVARVTSVGWGGNGREYSVSNLPGDLTGPFYVCVSNGLPGGGEPAVSRVIRSDGKVLKVDNAWVSKSRTRPADSWNYAFNLFDVNPPGGASYAVVFEAAEVASNAAPAWAITGGQVVYAGRTSRFTVHATDGDGDMLTLLSSGAAGHSFTDFGDGYGQFSWNPGAGDAGEHDVTFTAGDGKTNSTMIVKVTVGGVLRAGDPAWWHEHGLIVAGAAVNDFAPVNAGQLKNIAWHAYKEMEKICGGTNGAGGAGFVLAATNNLNNYVAVNIGQAKAVAAPFYEQLGMTFPYATNNATPNDFAMVNIGQIKNLFSFDPLKDSDGDGLPDWWESRYGRTNDAENVTNRYFYYSNQMPQ